METFASDKTENGNNNHQTPVASAEEVMEFTPDLLERFKETITVFALKLKKSETQLFMDNFGKYLNRIKGINPVEKLEGNNAEFNRVLVTFTLNEKEEFNSFCNKELQEEKKVKKRNKITTEKITFYEQEEIIITLDYTNFNYHECMKKILPEEMFNSAPKSFEIIGNIAHLNLRDEFLKYKKLIGKIIIDKNPSIKTVVNKTGKIDNVFRTYEMEVLAGPENFEVKHKEVNCFFNFDIRKVYWSSRLQAERDRLLTKFKKGEVLVDAFCGVGPLAIRAAKQNVKVYANDLNPDCYNSLVENSKINKVTKNLTAYNMDAREFIRSFIHTSKVIKDETTNFDSVFPENVKVHHIHMNLPKDACEFLDVFIGLFNNTKPELYSKNNLPIVHIYAFSGSLDSKKELLDRCAKAMGLETFPESCLIDFHNVRDISPKKYVFCISFMVPPEVAYK